MMTNGALGKFPRVEMLFSPTRDEAFGAFEAFGGVYAKPAAACSDGVPSQANASFFLAVASRSNQHRQDTLRAKQDPGVGRGVNRPYLFERATNESLGMQQIRRWTAAGWRALPSQTHARASASFSPTSSSAEMSVFTIGAGPMLLLVSPSRAIRSWSSEDGPR